MNELKLRQKKKHFTVIITYTGGTVNDRFCVFLYYLYLFRCVEKGLITSFVTPKLMKILLEPFLLR